MCCVKDNYACELLRGYRQTFKLFYRLHLKRALTATDAFCRPNEALLAAAFAYGRRFQKMVALCFALQYATFSLNLAGQLIGRPESKTRSRRIGQAIRLTVNF